ncbi:MAG: hypothetical protein ACI865_002522 [Flavobacteriaceae bacterium]|jgi:hypothetical protein
MKFSIEPKSVQYPEAREKLMARFPDYSFDMRGKNLLIAKKSSSVGANIMIRKNKIIVGGNFPTMGGTMLFALTLILLGVLIPIIVYFAVFNKNMKAMEKEIGDFLQEEYQTV